MSSLHTRDISPVLNIWFANVFSQSIDCLFILWSIFCGAEILVFLKDFIIWERDKEREHEQGGEREGEADSRLSRELHMGLYPRILGSEPEPKTDAQLSHPVASDQLTFDKDAKATEEDSLFNKQCFNWISIYKQVNFNPYPTLYMNIN